MYWISMRREDKIEQGRPLATPVSTIQYFKISCEIIKCKCINTEMRMHLRNEINLSKC